MFKTSVTYDDFNDESHTEDLYFHMSRPDILDLQFNPMVGGDLAEWIREGMRKGEGQKLWTTLKLLVVNSYGRRSSDGANFTKKAEFTEEFLNSPAFDAFFQWLLLDSPDGTHAEQFYTGIMPKGFAEQMADLEAQQETAQAVVPASPVKKKITDMSREELEAAFREKTKSGEHRNIDA